MKSLKNWFIASDVDGCLTTNVKHVVMMPDGVPLVCKSYSDRDSAAIHWFINNGATVVLISGDSRINPEWAHGHDIPFIYVKPGENKYIELVKRYPGIFNKYFVYIGDGEIDIPCMLQANIALYPIDASFAVKNAMRRKYYSIELPIPGGGGVFDWAKEVLTKVI